MSKQTEEAKVKATIKKHLSGLGSYWCMPATFGMGSSGTPDILTCINGVFVGIECKGNRRNKTTALQRIALQRILDNGGVAIVADMENIERVTQALWQIAHNKLANDFDRDMRRAQDKELV